MVSHRKTPLAAKIQQHAPEPVAAAEQGVAVKFDVSTFLKSLTSKPGVYRMVDKKGDVIYVGKARNLKKRVSSYFQAKDRHVKTISMVSQIANVEITITNTEGEALLLENNLIKELKPRYNILYRDDKSYPYIYLDTTHDFPRLGFHRGARKKQGEYFGPYPSAGSVRESLNLLQKVFQIRQCEDSFFRNRARPCLQYQIKRCTAPCVGNIGKEDYARDMHLAVLFLQGKSSLVVEELVRNMENASQSLEYEKAAHYRDQIASLRRVQEKQYISAEHGNVDVLAAVEKNGIGCVQVFFIRDGRNLGNKTFFPKYSGEKNVAEILAAFIPQYYLSQHAARIIPPQLIINHAIEETQLMEQVLSEKAESKVSIVHRVRGDRAAWVRLAESNARGALINYIANKANIVQRFEALQDALELDSVPQRIECFDISHTQGAQTVASCVVMDANGLVKTDYRRFNIEGITPGDDYAAMQQALTRRYTRLKKGEGKLPDILFIDGGKGQLSEAEKVLEELQVTEVLAIGIAKGSDRKPGLETLFKSDRKRPIYLQNDSIALHLIQQIRDEAHRFAITGHRQRRKNTTQGSILDNIPGLGPKRRQVLLKQFGGLQGLQRAGVEDLANTQGISKQLAKVIYDTLHDDS